MKTTQARWLISMILVAGMAGSCAKDSSFPEVSDSLTPEVPAGQNESGPSDGNRAYEPGVENETAEYDDYGPSEGQETPGTPEIPETPVPFGPVEGVWHITTADELFVWGGASEDWSSRDVVSIEADLDLENRLWTPPDGFSGTFEGNGKRISRIRVDVSGAQVRTASFFGLNTVGTIRNVTFGSSDGINYDGSSIIRMVSRYDSAFSYMGLVAQGAPKMSGVKSFIPLSLNDGSSGCRVKMGGLLGETSAGASLENCVMAGSLSLNSGTGSPHSVGGLIGFARGETSIYKCSNRGAVVSCSPYSREVGGLVGAHLDGVGLTLTESSNAGAVTAYDWQSSSLPGYVGGIVGHGCRGLTMSACVNSAAVSAQTERPEKWRVGGIAGQVENADVYACTNTGTITGTSRLTGALIGMMGQGASHHGCEARGKVVTPAATATLSFTNCSLWARGGNVGGTDGDVYYNGVRSCTRGAYCGFTSQLNTQTYLSDAKLAMLDVAYYTYVVPQPDGSLSFEGMSDAYVQGFVQRCHKAGVKVLLTFFSSNLASVVGNASTRNNLVNNLVAAVEKFGFDGVDNDWETPKSSDGTHLTNEAFMQALSTRLAPEGRFTTAAITPGKYAGSVRDGITDNTVAACDWLNIMIYDDYSTTAEGCNHSSIPFFDTSYNYWVGQRHMPASKFVAGLPCYGRPSGCAEAGWLCIPLRTIVANGGSVDADSASGIPYNGKYYTIYYNGRPTIKAKVDLCVSRRYGGYFFWEVAEDYAPSSSTLQELNKSLVYYAGSYLKTTFQK